MVTSLRIVLLLFSVIIWNSSINGQDKSIDMEYASTGNDGARKMFRTKKGGYLLGGWQNMKGIHAKSEGVVYSVDAVGKLLWKKTLVTNGHNQVSAVMQNDEGTIIAAIEEFATPEEPGQVVLTELTENDGTVIAKHRIGGPGSEVADKIQQTPDGGYILVGESSKKPGGNLDAWVMKLSKSFETEWEWSQNGTPGRDRLNDIVLFEDGSMVVAGNATRPGKKNDHKEQVPWFIKLNSKGKQIWSSQPEMKDAASIRGLTPASDGGIIFSGFTFGVENREFNSWIGKISADGKLVWQKSSDIPKNDYLHAVIRFKKDHYVAVGAKLGETNDALIGQFSEDGSWIKYDNHPKIGKQEARAVLSVNEKSIVIAGASAAPDSKEKDVWFLKLDMFKTKHIDKTYGTKAKDGLRNMLVLKDGGYLLAGWIEQTTKNHVGKGYLLNVDAAGKKRWEQVFTTNGNNRITNVFNHNKGFLIVVEEFPVENDPGQVVLMELDANGNMLNKHEFGGEGSDIIEIMRPAPDGGYFFVGESSVSNMESQAWIGKLSSSLEVTWQKHIGANGNDRFTDCAVLENGSVVAVGYVEKPNTDGGFYDSPLMVKANAQGKVLWTKEPSFKEAGALRGISKGKEGKFALVGYARKRNGKEFDAWVGIASASGDMIWDKTIPSPGFDSLMAVESTLEGHFVAIGSGKNIATDNDAMLVHFSDSGDNVDTYFVRKPGKQFGRVLYPIDTSGIAIGGFDLNGTDTGDQLWLHVTDIKTLQEK